MIIYQQVRTRESNGLIFDTRMESNYAIKEFGFHARKSRGYGINKIMFSNCGNFVFIGALHGHNIYYVGIHVI